MEERSTPNPVRPARWTRAGRASAALALAVTSALGALHATSASAAPTAGTPASAKDLASAPTTLANAGTVTMWGASETGHTTVPASLRHVPMSQVVIAAEATLGLTAQGKVVGWGGGTYRLQRVPDAVNAQPIAQIAVNLATWAGAVTRDGRVLTWGAKVAGPSILNVPAGLSGVKQLALTGNGNAIALKTDGRVVAWGQAPDVNASPPGLRATQIAADTETALALTDQGTVVGWGGNGPLLDLPAVVQQPAKVKALATADGNAIALLNDNTIVAWGTVYRGDRSLPTWPTGTTPVAISGSGKHFGMVDSQGTLHQWYPADAIGANPAPEVNGMIPASLQGGPTGGYSSGGIDPAGAVITTTLLKATDPTITGTPTTGSTLTAVPGTFSASPTVTGQWLANGTPITGATGTTLKLTAPHVGKKISYRSTAAKPGEATLTATSNAVTATNPAPPAPTVVSSSITVTAAKVAKAGKTFTLTGRVRASKPTTGRATVTLKKGKKKIVTKTVTVAANGTFKLTVKKFATTVAKKTKAKGKKATKAYRGKYVASVVYSGNSQVRSSSTTRRFSAK